MADQSGPKITLLGAKGVYLDQNPMEMPDGSWRRLLNGEFAITGERTVGRAQGGIRKRGGLSAWNTGGSLGGEVLAIAGVPLASAIDFTTRLIVAMNTAAGATAAWKTTTDGTTFTNLATSVLPRCYQNRSWVGVDFDDVKPPRAATYQRNTYYPSQDYAETNPPANPPLIAVYTGGGTGYNVGPISRNTTSSQQAYAITDMVQANNVIYMSVFDQDAKARVLSFDPVTGAIQLVGPEFTPPGGSSMCIEYYQGRVWVGIYTIPGLARGYIYSIRPGQDTSWTLERTSAADGGGYHALITYNGALYACTDADAIGTAVIEQRTAAGVWSTSFTAPSAGVSRFSGAIVFNGELYVGWYKPAATTAALIKKYNGTSWTTDLDIKATYALKAPGNPTVFNSELYWPVWDPGDSISATNFLMKRTTGGVWSRPLTGVALQGTSTLYYPAPTS